jgi:diguanylate cyclase (GGDEF)-like protein
VGSHSAERTGPGAAARVSMALALAFPVAFVVSTIPGVRPSSGYSLLLDGWLNNLAYASAPVICLLRLRSVRGRDRTAGLLLALALALYGGGNVFWTIVVRPIDPEPFPSGADALFLAFYPLVFVALLLMRGRRDRRLPLSEWLDGLVGGLAVAALAAALIAQPLVATFSGSWAAVATTAAYPLLDLVLLLIVVTTLSLFHWRPPLGVWLLAVGLLLFVVADGQYLVATAQVAYVSGGPNDGLWVIATITMAASPGWASRTTATRLPTWGMLVIPTASALTALGLLLEDHTHRLHPIALGLATATLLLSLARLMVTVREVDLLAHSRELALTDELTGLGNRRALFELAPARIARLPADQQVALLLLDLDRFKEINDSLGHQAGDAMLRIVAARLLRSVRRSQVTLVRLGGDEFAFLLLGVDLGAAYECARQAHEALTAPVRLEGMTVWVGASIGVTVADAAEADLTVLLREADVAMYQAKGDHDDIVIYSPERDVFANSDRLETIELLRHAISAREMVLHYQPKIESDTKRVQGVEALVRWNHPTRGLLPPETFLELLEDIGLMRELTHCVLDLALDQLVRWRDLGRYLTVSVNLPASALIDLGLPEWVAGMLAARGLPAECLEIEITEEFLMGDRDRARDILGRLRAQGVRIAVDDFGTGYSSLAYLKELPVDVLKLDKSFLRDILVDPRAMAIVDSTISLAHSLGLNLVAEGVEDDLTSSRLAESGCDLEQGWFYSKALPAGELEAWLDQQFEQQPAGPGGPGGPAVPAPRAPAPSAPAPAVGAWP